MIIYMKKTKEVIVVLIGILLMNIKMECIQLVVVVTKIEQMLNIMEVIFYMI